jgi:hypothetical protein
MRELRLLFALFCLAIAGLWIIQAAIVVHGTGDDWKIFWSAGHHVGSLELLTVSHFVYMPGAAWSLWLFAHFTRPVGYSLYTALMIGLAIGAAVLASSIYRMSAMLTTLMTLAWWPLTIAVCLGQTSPLALFLTTAAIFALVNDMEVLLGMAVGAAFYKPTIALPFVVLLLIFRQWKALGVVAASLAVWFILSVAATHDWLWPNTYIHTLTSLYRVDRVVDGDYSISLPGVLIHMGLSPAIGWGLGLVMLLATIPILARSSRLEAATIIPLIGLATTPHAYGYDALLVLPMLWLLSSKASPERWTLVALSYVIAPLYLFSRRLHFDALAIPVILSVVGWAIVRIRTKQYPGPAESCRIPIGPLTNRLRL